MEIINKHPPMWDEIKAQFNPPKGVIFAWGNKIYNPSGAVIPKSLIVHEEVHSERQGQDVVGWWRRYIDEPEFRLQEEIPAHQAEYKCLMERARNRNERRIIEKTIAVRLASPLYGRLISSSDARKLLKFSHVDH